MMEGYAVCTTQKFPEVKVSSSKSFHGNSLSTDKVSLKSVHKQIFLMNLIHLFNNSFTRCDLDLLPDMHQKLIAFFLDHTRCFHQVSSKSVENFLRYLVDKQTYRQTNGKHHIIPSGEGIKTHKLICPAATKWPDCQKKKKV